MNNSLIEYFESLISGINDFIWTYFVIIAIAAVGIYFTVSLKFIQFTHIKEMFRLLGEGVKPSSGDKKKSISSFQAFCISTAARVGTGNMAGVATALALGGPGAAFWMWIMAIIGAASAFSEATLAQVFKIKGDKSFIGGPSYYMEKGLGLRFMGIIFAVLLIITYGFAFNTVQSNTIAQAFKYSFNAEYAFTGIVLAICTAIVIFGGIHRIALFSQVIVPVMAGIYILITLFIVVVNITEVPQVLVYIFEDAIGLRQVGAGMLGAGIMMGIRRGLFSNEAGMGSAPNASATASVSHPAKQGFIQALGVFTDTLLICSCTVFIVLLSGVSLDGSVVGIQLNQLAFDSQFGQIGHVFVSVSILLFAFSSILGNYYYGEMNILFITGNKNILFIYRVMVIVIVFFGAITSLGLVWGMADITMALMTICNLIALIMLRKVVLIVTNDYRNKKKKGIRSPDFSSDDLPLYKDKIKDIWD